LIKLAKNQADSSMWAEMHQYLFGDVTTETDNVLNHLADDLKLSVSEEFRKVP
jgi:hypothetical protein